jgi:hypothetical protein
MVLGLWFESVRVMFPLFIISNALPVPLLRQVSSIFIDFMSFHEISLIYMDWLAG